MSPFNKLLDKLICLECNQDPLAFVRVNRGNGILHCSHCGNIHLLRDGVFIFLPNKYEIKSPYREFLTRHRDFLREHPVFDRLIKAKIDKLPAKSKAKWEDEDIQYWDEQYAKEPLVKGVETYQITGSRLFPREQQLFKILRKRFKKDDFIFEIGSGDARTVRRLFSPITYDYNYIVSDYSLEAMKYLRQLYRGRGNVFCFQCLGDKLPFRDDSLNAIICLGVLHHMPKKETHLAGLINKLVPNGLLLGYESYEREYQLPHAIKEFVEGIFEPAHSHHEERINYRNANKLFSRFGELINEYHEYSPTRTLMVKLFSNQIEKSAFVTKLCLALDQFTIQTIGRVWKLFGAGGYFFVFRKN